VGGSAALFFDHPFFLIMAMVVGAVVVLSLVVSLGLFLWTSVYGGEVPREQAFRLMRFIAAREEPRAPVLALVPAQASRTGVQPGVQGQAAEPGPASARVRSGASQRPGWAALACIPGHSGQHAAHDPETCTYFTDAAMSRGRYGATRPSWR
jgi:hypothetical protein